MKLRMFGTVILILSSFVLHAACSTLANGNQASANTNSDAEGRKSPVADSTNNNVPIPNETSEGPKKGLSIDTRDISESIGLVSLNERYDTGSSVRIYNQDGSVWYESAKSGEDQSELKLDKDLHPFRMNAVEFLLVFDCVGEDRDFFHVIVDETTKVQKFIRKDDPNFKFGTWEDYILNCFAVNFDRETNPLRSEVNGQILDLDIQGNLTFQPKEIRGDWLRVNWRNGDTQEQETKSAWIRWKKDQTIVVNLFETA